MNQQQQNHCLRRDKVGPEPPSASLPFSVQAVKAVMILCVSVGSSGHSLLAYAIIQYSHKLALKVGLSLHLHTFLACDKISNC